MPSLRRAGVVAALTGVPLAFAYRFAIVYRARAGFPRRMPPAVDPGAFGLPFEDVVIEAPDASLPAWFIPARDGAPGPGVLLIHGWESARDRMLPNALVLHAAGFHVLTLDVRGHGASLAESLPISGGEFGLDAAAGIAALRARPEVTTVGVLGHSMGGVGTVLAAADSQPVDALVVVSAPADPVRLTRQTFRLAGIRLPDPVAYPLAWLTTQVYVRPRRHVVRRISSPGAIRRYHGPLLLVHGDEDRVIPLSHHTRLAAEARRGRASLATPAPIETLIVPGGAHSWLYEHEVYRRRIAAFLSRELGGPLDPDDAAARAAATDAHRLPEAERAFAAIERPNARLRTLAELFGAPVHSPDEGLAAGPAEAPAAERVAVPARTMEEH
jgi:pimeloyl-ACP methyl ester carboxylesterase